MKNLLYFFTNNLLSLTGRIDRKEFIHFLIILMITSLVTITSFLSAVFPANIFMKVIFVLIVPFWIICFIQLFATTTQRLHDINLSGWWQVPIILIPYGKIFLLILCFIRGTSGPNKYGNISELHTLQKIRCNKLTILYLTLLIIVLTIGLMLRMFMPDLIANFKN